MKGPLSKDKANVIFIALTHQCPYVVSNDDNDIWTFQSLSQAYIKAKEIDGVLQKSFVMGTTLMLRWMYESNFERKLYGKLGGNEDDF
jgi:hypothetical protein